VSLYSNRHQKAEASALLNQSKETEAQLTDAIKMEVNQNWHSYQQSKERLSVMESAVQQSEENFRITDNQYKNQLVLQSDLQIASNTLLKSKIDFTNAQADARLNYYQLMKSCATLPSIFQK
jgi:outer membrane protein TolC